LRKTTVFDPFDSSREVIASIGRARKHQRRHVREDAPPLVLTGEAVKEASYARRRRYVRNARAARPVPSRSMEPGSGTPVSWETCPSATLKILPDSVTRFVDEFDGSTVASLTTSWNVPPVKVRFRGVWSKLILTLPVPPELMVPVNRAEAAGAVAPGGAVKLTFKTNVSAGLGVVTGVDPTQNCPNVKTVPTGSPTVTKSESVAF
jgi:hypothetical protein